MEVVHSARRKGAYEANVVPRDDICIIKHGLKIPIDAENYESFVSKMQVSESEFRQVFIG